MRLFQYYFPLSVMTLVVAVLVKGWLATLLLFWAGLSLMLAAAVQAAGKPDRWRKRLDGRYRLPMLVACAPLALGVYCYSAVNRQWRRWHGVQRVGKYLYFACELTPLDMRRVRASRVMAVLDVTAEFPGLGLLRQPAGMDYLAVPVAPGRAPREDQLRRMLNWLDAHRKNETPVLIHSARGSSNALFVVVAQLLALNPKKSARELVEQMAEHIKGVKLSESQLGALERYRREGAIQALNHAWIIANPVAGGGKWHSAEAMVLERLEKYFRLTVTTTTERISARDLAMKALADQADVVIACGGDGTLAEVADVIADSDAVLGMMPLGTSNSLCFSLWGVEAKVLPVETACDHIIAGNVRSVDVADCNGQTMLLAMGVGFEQAMISAADRGRKDQSGQFAYLQGLWDSLQKNDIQQLRVAFDDGDFESIDTSSLVVANASPFSAVLAQGGGKPSISDGLLDVTWLDPRESASENLQSLAQLLISGLTDTPATEFVHHRKVERIRLRAVDGGSLDYVLDGEVLAATEIDLCVHARSLDILSPAAVDGAQA